jgi:hypothetical protein
MSTFEALRRPPVRVGGGVAGARFRRGLSDGISGVKATGVLDLRGSYENENDSKTDGQDRDAHAFSHFAERFE